MSDFKGVEAQYPVAAPRLEVTPEVSMELLTAKDAPRFLAFFEGNRGYLEHVMPPKGVLNLDVVQKMLSLYDNQYPLGKAAVYGISHTDAPEVLQGNVQYRGREGDSVHLGYMRAEHVPAEVHMTQIVGALVDHCEQDLGIKTFYAAIAPANTASQRLIQKLGGVLDSSFAENHEGEEMWVIRRNG